MLARVQNEDSENFSKWCQLVDDVSRLKCFFFTQLHKAYLGLSAEKFNRELCEAHVSDIDETNESGRTLPSWAAQRGDIETIEMLLSLG